MGWPPLGLIVSFMLLLAVNVPVAVRIGTATLPALWAVGDDLPALAIVAQKMATGVNKFALLGILFFVLSGLLMGHGGIARRLIDCANVFVRPFRGGLAYVNTATCMLFGSISGSAAAAVRFPNVRLRGRLIFHSHHRYASRGVVQYAVIELPRWKLTYTYHRTPVGPGWRRTRFALYDLRGGLYADEDVIDEHHEVARRLIGELLAYRHHHRPYEPSSEAEALELDTEQIRQLESLGYVEGENDEARRD